MYRLTQQEQIAFMIGIFSVILIIIEMLFFLTNFNTKLLFLGGTTFGVSIVVIYFFVIQPMKGKIRKASPYDQHYTSTSSSFRPTIILPSKRVKKTIMRGSCEYCGKKELMGFTCSYCDSYFCPEHRLPEKHDCSIINLR